MPNGLSVSLNLIQSVCSQLAIQSSPFDFASRFRQKILEKKISSCSQYKNLASYFVHIAASSKSKTFFL